MEDIKNIKDIIFKQKKKEVCREEGSYDPIFPCYSRKKQSPRQRPVDSRFNASSLHNAPAPAPTPAPYHKGIRAVLSNENKLHPFCFQNCGLFQDRVPLVLRRVRRTSYVAAEASHFSQHGSAVIGQKCSRKVTRIINQEEQKLAFIRNICKDPVYSNFNFPLPPSPPSLLPPSRSCCRYTLYRSSNALKNVVQGTFSKVQLSPVVLGTNSPRRTTGIENEELIQRLTVVEGWWLVILVMVVELYTMWKDGLLKPGSSRWIKQRTSWAVLTKLHDRDKNVTRNILFGDSRMEFS
ncbi:hypothetical protein V1478_011353 [Vespula squamosa]|uniref:Uncharacterized protein n=1 Tax=Vespula squamosa TaxID=30214 RepID=A0ABD2AE87_VESSQ